MSSTVMERRAPVSDATLKAEYVRFEKVMAARKKSAALLELFDKLSSSDKFSDEAKPGCYVRLFDRASRLLPDKSLPALLTAVASSVSLEYVRQDLPEQEAELMVARLVRRVFERNRNEAEADTLAQAMVDAFKACIGAALADNRSHVLKLLHVSGMSLDELDVLCDLTHDLWYR